MTRGIFSSFSAALVLGAAVFAASAQAAPLPPISVDTATVPAENFERAVVSQNEVDQIKPVQVRWHHHHWHHHRWHHRHWHHHRHW